MKKPFKFTEMSDTVCLFPNCTKHIKLNVLARKPSTNKCYKHFMLEKGYKVIGSFLSGNRR